MSKIVMNNTSNRKPNNLYMFRFSGLKNSIRKKILILRNFSFLKTEKLFWKIEQTDLNKKIIF